MEAENLPFRKGLWTEEEDKILTDYIGVHGRGQWNRISKVTGLKRCGKSCRLRWMNYLSPNVKRSHFSEEEDDLIIRLHKLLGNRWSLIAGRVPGRTDNQVKNHWNTHLSRRLGVKKDKRKSVGSSKTLSAKVAKPRRHSLMDSKPKLSCGDNAKDIKATINEDPLDLNGEIGGSNREAKPMAKHCSEPLWFFNDDQFNVDSPGFMEFLNGYSDDQMWQGL